MVTTVDNSHGLQAETLHINLGREQETVVEIIEEDSGIGDHGSDPADAVLLQEQAEEVLAYPNFILQTGVVHPEFL
jgi:hypothetical protein